MPNPQWVTSWLALAGAILILSALRAGAFVQATLWSGAGQFLTTQGFVRDERRLLQVLSGYLGGATAFPLHVLRDTHTLGEPRRRAAHIVIISDNGADTIYAADERGTPGRAICEAALARAAGGTMALWLPRPKQTYPFVLQAQQQGWHVYRLTDWEELQSFARDFSRQLYTREPVT
jgi:hypothetical protein